jgi:hypothetical protein
MAASDPGQLDWPSARLLIERLWVRAPPPECRLPQPLAGWERASAEHGGDRLGQRGANRRPIAGGEDMSYAELLAWLREWKDSWRPS